MKLFAGIAAFILLFAGAIQAQVLLPDNGYRSNYYTFHNHTYPDTLLRNTSYIIQELSVGNKVGQSESNYNMPYEVFTRKEKGSGKLTLGILLHKVHEPVTYKDFDIRNLLLPSGIRLNVSHLKNGRVIYSYRVIKTDLKQYDTTWIQLSDSLLKHTTAVNLENIDFFYNNEKLQKIAERLEMINDYYASKLIIDAVRTMAADLPLGSPSDFANNLIFLFELRKINERIKAKDFESSMGIRYHDPARLLEALRMLELLENRVQTLTNQTLPTKKNVTESEVEGAFDYYIDLQKTYINWARQAEHSYQESFYALLSKNYLKEDLGFYEHYLKKLNAEDLLPFAYQCFYNKNLEFIEHCINDQLYLNALGVLTSIKNFSSLAPEYADLPDIGKYSSRAKHGLYDSYIRVARRAIKVNSFALAREYLTRAEDYQRANASFIISDIEVRIVRQLLTDAYLSSAANDIMQREYESALHLLHLANQASKAGNEVSFEENLYDSLLINAKKGIFQNFLATASAYFNAGDFADARAFLNKAAEYNSQNEGIPGGNSVIINLPAYESYLSEAKNRFEEGDYEEALLILEKLQSEKSPLIDAGEVDNLINQAAKLLAVRLISDVENQVFNNNTVAAEASIAYADSIISKYNINDPGLISALSGSRNSVIELICRNYLNEYNELLRAGDEMINQRNFIAANKYFLEAAELHTFLEECGINDKEAEHRLIHYSGAADYQRKMEEIRNSLYKEGFSAVIDDYLQLEEEYYEKNLRGLNVKHTSFEEFLLDQKNPDLIVKAFHYFYEKDNCLESLKMLDLLKQLNFSRSKTRNMQRDAAELCFNKKVEISGSYTDKKEEWFQFFRKRTRMMQKQQKIKQIFKKGN